MTAPLSLRDLNRATLARQMLLARETITPLRAIERLVALQAQWPKPPYIALWSRLESFARGDLTKLYARRDVVRAPMMMRGTIHTMLPKDYLAMRPVIQPVLTRGVRSVLKERADTLDVEKLVRAARGFFAKEPRTFTELRAFLTKLHPKADERAMGFAVRAHLPLVMVPSDAEWGFPGNADFTVAEEWIGAPVGKSDDPSALVLRYLAAFGPATAGDVQEWTGLQGLRDVLEALRPKLVSLRDDRKREFFDLPKAPRPSGDTAAPVRLLGEFDNVILGHADRTRVLAKEHRSIVFAPGLRVLQTFLVDGFAAGIWKIERVKQAATLVLEPFGKLSKATSAELMGEANALLRFTEPDATAHDVRIAKT